MDVQKCEINLYKITKHISLANKKTRIFFVHCAYDYRL